MIIFRCCQLLIVLTFVSPRKHHLNLQGDKRPFISLSRFGYDVGGSLFINLTNFSYHLSKEHNISGQFGFTLDRTTSAGIAAYIEQHTETCIFELPKNRLLHQNLDIIFMRFHPLQEKVEISRHGSAIESLSFYKRPEDYLKRNVIVTNKRSTKAANGPSYTPKAINTLPLKKSGDQYSLEFYMVIENMKEAGLFNLYFHNCLNMLDSSLASSSFNIYIEEANGIHFLSAGEIRLPATYLFFAVLFFMSSIAWLYYLCNNRQESQSIHYLMLVLVIVKAVTLLLHSLVYHIIDIDGHPIEAWAVLYYVTYLFKGVLLFVTVILIGTGWSFVKHIFSSNEKKVFFIVIPLQVITNLAYIVRDSTEKGDQRYALYNEVFILVDLLCCGAILLPVVWSIRHLQEASRVDGKAATNLAKLKIFRHFYIMIVCYIYFTRIVVYLLQVLVPYQYNWVSVVCREAATIVFFLFTATMFSPGKDNVYLRVSNQFDDEHSDESEELIETTVYSQKTPLQRPRNIKSSVL